jgi:protein-tyrosine-phosphatase
MVMLAAVAPWCSYACDDIERMEPISPELVLVDPKLASAVRDGSAHAVYRVSFVCTGNRFRSALAEAAFRAATDGLPLEVTSFGILELGSARPLREAVRAAEAYGLEISAHLATPLSAADLSETSLVVGFEARHGTAAIELAGARPERVFLLLELVDLLGDVRPLFEFHPIERAAAAVARAQGRRGAEPAQWARREIPDPAEMREADQAVVGRVVCEGATRLAQLLFGPVC